MTVSVLDYKMYKMGIGWYSTVGLSLVYLDSSAAGKLTSCQTKKLPFFQWP